MASVKVDRDLVRAGNDWYSLLINNKYILNPGWHEYQLILGFYFPHLGGLISFKFFFKKVWERCRMY